MKPQKKTRCTTFARMAITSLQLLINSAENDIEYLDETVYTRQVRRAIATAELAIKKAKLRKGVFT